MNGTISLPDGYNRLEFQSDMHVREFKVNELLIGDITGINKWNPESRKFDIEVDVDRLGERTVDVSGTYDPTIKDNPLDAKATFVDTRLQILGPLLRGLFSEIDGQLTGSYTIRGDFAEPAITGVGTISNGQMKVDYLGTL